MKYTIKNFVNVIFIFLLSTTFAIAQTASILPPGKTSFFDANGNPLVNGAITFYSPGTTTLKTTWQDSAQTTPNTNPVILDAAGRALIYGSGTYQQVVRDRSNNIIWNVQTASTGSSGGGTTATVGDGDSVGTVKPWAGFAAPSAYAFAYGQEFLRSSFPELFAALTSQQNVSCTLGTPVLSGLSSTEMLPINSKLESSCVSAGTTIISKTISTVTVSSNAIISTTTSVRFFPWGNGDGNSTFNTPDLRGRVLPGRDNMGGNAANRLSTTFYGVPSIAIGAAGGLDNHQLTIQEMPSHAHGVFLTDNGHAHGLQNLKTNQVQGGTSFSAYAVAGSPPGTLFADSNQTGITINNGTGTNNLTVANGGTAAHSIVQPSITINYIIKILPDTNPNSYFGVASIGGMTGVLTCGFGLTCSGNSISAVNSTLPPPTLTTLGGVFQSVVSSNLFLTGIDTTGTFTTGQVSFAGLTGFISTSQIPNNSINNNMLTPGAALSVTGNVNNAPANRTDITGITDQILRINSAGNTLGFGSINLAGSAAVGSSILPLTNGGTNSSLQILFK
jgi:microcystin-dependent protein